MNAPIPPALRERFDLDDLERDSSTIIALDGEGRIRWVNASWYRLAEQHGAPDLPARYGIGTPYFETTQGPLRAFYESRLRQCLSSGQPLECEYECSSPEAQRLFQLRILPVSPDLALFVHSLRVAWPHPGKVFAPDEGVYRDANGLITQCSNCRRVRRPNPEAWDWVPAWALAQPARVSHAICAPCLGFYYPDLGR